MIFLEYAVVVVTVSCATLYGINRFRQVFRTPPCEMGDCGCTEELTGKEKPKRKQPTAVSKLPAHIRGKA
jgi:hypothetical protein